MNASKDGTITQTLTVSIPDEKTEMPDVESLDLGKIQKINRKIDGRILPILAVLYLLSFLDR